MISPYIIVSESVHSLMVYSFVMLPISFIVIIDAWPKDWKKLNVKITQTASVLLVALLCWNFMITANHNYLRMDLTDQQDYAYSSDCRTNRGHAGIHNRNAGRIYRCPYHGSGQ